MVTTFELLPCFFFFFRVRSSKFYCLRNGGSGPVDSLLEPVCSGTVLPRGPFCDGGNCLDLCCPRWQPPDTSGWTWTMACAKEELYFKFYLILINLKLTLNGFMWLVATILDGAIPECWHFLWWDEVCWCGLDVILSRHCVSGGHSFWSDPTWLQTRQEKFREIFKSSSCPKGSVMFDQGSLPGPWEQGFQEGLDAALHGWLLPSRGESSSKRRCRTGAGRFLKVPQGKPRSCQHPRSGVQDRRVHFVPSAKWLLGSLCDEASCWATGFWLPDCLGPWACIPSFPQPQTPFLPNPTVGSHLMNLLEQFEKSFLKIICKCYVQWANSLKTNCQWD